MDSQEVAEALPSSVLPGSQVEPEMVNNSLYQPVEQQQNYQKGELQALGILNGAIILALAVLLTTLQHLSEVFKKFTFFLSSTWAIRYWVLYLGSEIELSEAPFSGNILLEKDISLSRQTWLIFLKKELEFLGVTQILIGFIYLYFGTIIYPGITISEFEKDFFSSFRIGYPFWGAVLFVISGFLSVMSEKKNATYLMYGSLGANLVSSLAAGTGIVFLVVNLKNTMAYHNICRKAYQDDFCFTVFFSTEIVAMIMFLTILGFGVAVLLIVYRVGELLKEDKIPEDRLYEELNVYSPIYSDLEEKEETSPTDS